MPVSGRLSRKLYETFGEDGGREMLDWMQHMDAQRAELRELADLQFARFSSMLSEQITGLRQEMNLGLARVETKIEQRSADLIKWSFVFWVGAVGAIALLAGILK